MKVINENLHTSGIGERQMVKRYRAPIANTGQLKMQWGKLSGDTPDMCMAWGEGCSKSDSNLLYSYMLTPKNHYMQPKQGLSLKDELEARGYDITTLKFSIQKKSEPSN